MSTRLKSFMNRLSAPFWPQGRSGVRKLGHRGYVGGMWEEIGTLQFEFLLARGLKPEHVLLDIACGALRLGVKAIPYLQPDHYLGIEKEVDLANAGLEVELPLDVRREKRPTIVISDSFEFDKLPRRANYAIAQSLFSHFPPDLINLCCRKLQPFLAEGGVFYATYHETKVAVSNPRKPHDHGYYAYTKEQMLAFGNENGFVANYIGDWRHPRQQVMMEYRKTVPSSRA